MEKNRVGPSCVVRWGKDGKDFLERDSSAAEKKGERWWRNWNDLPCRGEDPQRQEHACECRERGLRRNHVQGKAYRKEIMLKWSVGVK